MIIVIMMMTMIGTARILRRNSTTLQSTESEINSFREKADYRLFSLSPG